MSTQYDFVVYKTTEISTGKIYIGYDSFNKTNYYGSGKYFLNRIHKIVKEYTEETLKEVYVEEKYHPTFYNRYKEYIPLFFKKEILGYYNTKEEMKNAEVKFIEKFDARNKEIGYNIGSGGDGGAWWGDDNTKNPFYGKHHTKESIEKQRQKIIGRKHTEEELEKMREFRHKESSKIQMSNTRKGMKKTEEWKLKIKESNKKTWANVELRKQISDINRGRIHTEEELKKMSKKQLKNK